MGDSSILMLSNLDLNFSNSNPTWKKRWELRAVNPNDNWVIIFSIKDQFKSH